MKMKTVCEQTGLTDRAVRYYIEEGLIDPEYIENYLGRLAYAFSDQDVAALKDVVVLRKYGFSVAEIRQMQSEPKTIPSLLGALRTRKCEGIAEEQSLLDVLLAVDAEQSASVRELSAALSDAADQIAAPREDTRLDYRQRAFRLFCRLFSLLIALLELLGCVVIVWLSCMDYHYPKGSPKARALTILFLIPAVLTVVLPLFRTKAAWLCRMRRIVAVICVLCLLPSLLFSFALFDRSETNTIWAYRRFDLNCPANYDGAFQSLFPMESMFLDGKQYYYCYQETVFGKSCVILSEWQLKDDEFAEEVDRVRELFEKDYPKWVRWDRTVMQTYQQGNYICLLRYEGQSPITEVQKSEGHDGVYYLFAYDESEKTVRYLYFYSEIGDNSTSYYNSLNWD